MKRTPLVVVAALGLALSLALEVLHVRAYLAPAAQAFCAVGERLDCTSVALSRYSVLLGVPVPLWGALGFLAILVAAIRRSRWLLPLTGAAAAASLALLVVELAVIGAVCLLCEAVHVASFVLFALVWRKRAELSARFGDRDDVVAIIAAPAGMLLALLLFLPRYWVVFAWKGDVPFAQGQTPEGHPWIGAENPKVTVHEFTDYQCPHCRLASVRSLKRLGEHPKSLRLVRRQFPRVRCPVGRENLCEGVRIAYCAQEQGRFWHADRWLFEHAPEGRLDVERAAADIGLDPGKLRGCITRSDIYERAAADAELAKRRRFPGTPYYVVGERRVSEEGLTKLLDEAL